MSKLLQVTVADDQGRVVDTGWIEVTGVSKRGTELGGAALFEHAVEWTADYGIEISPDEARRAYAEIVAADPDVETGR